MKNNNPCKALTRLEKPARPCKKPVATLKCVNSWPLKPKEAEIARALMSKYCEIHLRAVLDDLFPGAGIHARICGNRWKTHKRNNAKGIAAMIRLNRLGLVPTVIGGRAPPELQCMAQSKQAKRRCRNFRQRGRSTCRFHGGRSNGRPKLTEAQRAERRRLKQQRYLDRMQRLYQRQLRRESGMLDASTSFKPSPPPVRTLESDFRPVRPKPLKPLY
jgi:hypothetical protein